MEEIIRRINNGADFKSKDFDAYRANFDVCLAAVVKDGMAIHYTEFADNEAIVCTAIESTGLALSGASKRLQAKRYIVEKAVRQNGCAMDFAPEFKNDKAIALLAVRNDSLAVQFLDESLKNDPDIVSLDPFILDIFSPSTQ